MRDYKQKIKIVKIGSRVNYAIGFLSILVYPANEGLAMTLLSIVFISGGVLGLLSKTDAMKRNPCSSVAIYTNSYENGDGFSELSGILSNMLAIIIGLIMLGLTLSNLFE